MARVTAEDCVEKVPNRFELVMLAAQRARSITEGAPLTVDRDNDKFPVVALREIAGETMTPEVLREDLIRGYQRVRVSDDYEDDMVELMDGEESFAMPSPEDRSGATEAEELRADQLSVAEDDESDAGEPEKSEEG